MWEKQSPDELAESLQLQRSAKHAGRGQRHPPDLRWERRTCPPPPGGARGLREAPVGAGLQKEDFPLQFQFSCSVVSDSL